MIGQITGNMLDPHLIQAIAVQNLTAHIRRCPAAAAHHLAVFVEGAGHFGLRPQGKEHSGDNQNPIITVHIKIRNNISSFLKIDTYII